MLILKMKLNNKIKILFYYIIFNRIIKEDILNDNKLSFNNLLKIFVYLNYLKNLIILIY